MKIYTGEQPKNPCDKCLSSYETCPFRCPDGYKYEGQLSILNQCKDVGDIDELFERFCEREVRQIRLHEGVEYYGEKRFSQFIQSEIKKKDTQYTAVHNQDGSIDVYPKKQEGKDGK